MPKQKAIVAIFLTTEDSPAWQNLLDIALLTNRDVKDVVREWVRDEGERLLERCVCDELSKSRGLREAWATLPKGRLQ